MELLLPVPGVSGSTAPWCAIFRSGPEDGAYCYKCIGLKALRSCFDRQQAELGLKFRKIKAMHGPTLCGVACKRDKEVLVVCKPAAGGVLSPEVLAPVGSGNVGSWGLVTMSGDSARSLKIFVIEGCASGKQHQVAVYESRMQAWRKLCQLPAAMLSYVSSLYQLPSVVLGQFLYILLLTQGGVERTGFKIEALDYHRNEWSEFDVITPRAFSRLRLVGVQERLLLVGVREGRYVDRYFIMDVFLSTTKSTCVEVSEMPGEFSAALADESSAGVKLGAVVRGHKDSIFFMSSTGKPVIYSTTKNAWDYVPVLSKRVNTDNYVTLENLVRSRPRSASSFEHKRVRRSVAGRPPRWQSCRQPECNLVRQIVNGPRK